MAAAKRVRPRVPPRVTVSVRFEPDDHAALEAVARSSRLTIADVVRRLCRWGMREGWTLAREGD